MVWLLCLPAGQASYLASSYRSTLFLRTWREAGLGASALERGDTAAARALMATNSLTTGSVRAGSQPCGAFDLFVAGESEAALSR